MSKITIIIPAWPHERRLFAQEYLDRLDWPAGDLEILIARGLSPCAQRNTAARAAHGEILVFLDNDSCPEPACLHPLAPPKDRPRPRRPQHRPQADAVAH